MVSLIKTLMTLRGVNQAEIAKKSGVSSAALSRYFNESSELRSSALVKLLDTLGADVDRLVKNEINKIIGYDEVLSVGDDIRFLLDKANPITRKMIADTLIASFKTEKGQDTKNRILRLKKYRDSIKTVRR